MLPEMEAWELILREKNSSFYNPFSLTEKGCYNIILI